VKINMDRNNLRHKINKARKIGMGIKEEKGIR